MLIKTFFANDNKNEDKYHIDIVFLEYFQPEYRNRVS